MPAGHDRSRGEAFDDVPELYDRVRPSYPAELFDDLAAITGLDDRSSVLEVGCGTGQATRSLAAMGCTVTAVELGPDMAELARRRLATFSNVTVDTSSFETWEDLERRFDLIVAAAAWHWVDPSVGWRRAHDLLRPRGWIALFGHVVVRRPGEPEMYAETADLHERFAPGNRDWGHPPLEDEVRATTEGWGLVEAPPEGSFGSTVTRWYPMVQRLNGTELADLLSSQSPYRALDPIVRDQLLAAVADRIDTRLRDGVARRYLVGLRVGQRVD